MRKQPGPGRLVVYLLVLTGLAACGTTGDSRLSDLSLSDEPLTGKFVWHDLMTDDVAVAKKFYGSLLGWTFEDTVHPNGGDYTLISKNGQWIAGMVQLADPAHADYSRWLGYLSVADVDDAVVKTRSAGGSAVVGPLDLGNVGRAAAIKDPQNAVVGLVRSNLGDPDDTTEHLVGQIVWNELVTTDAAAAAEFYSALSGAQSRTTQRDDREYRVLGSQGHDRSGILQPDDETIDPFWLTHFAVTDPVQAASRVQELGGEVLLAPTDNVFNATVAVVLDPNGAILALHKWPSGAELGK